MKNWLLYGSIAVVIVLQTTACGQQNAGNAPAVHEANSAPVPANPTVVQEDTVKPGKRPARFVPQGDAPNQKLVDSLKNLPGDKK
jgi:hypothetical protein